MAAKARYPDCTNCEAPCCRRQYMENDDRWFRLKDIRPIYQAAGTDVRVITWERQPDGRQPMIECLAFDTKALRCGVYENRPEHCRTYDCRDDDPDDWRGRPHCDIARHRRMEERRERSTTTA